MDRMRATANKPREGLQDTHKAGEPNRKKHTGKGKDSEKPPKTVTEIAAKGAAAEINN
jgi:hypothetical protein